MCNDRAVSEIVGYSLVFTLVITSVAFISVGGLAGYQSAENFERQTNSQKAFDVMHNNLEDIYYQGAPSRGTEIDLGETSLTLADPVIINITVEGNDSWEYESQPIVQDLGEGNKLVYEAGAVFQTTSDGGRVRQTPPMILRGDTAHIIVPTLTDPASRSVAGGTVLIRAQSQTQQLRYQNMTQDGPTNITVNVTSSRSDLWYEYFVAQGAFNQSTCEPPADGDEEVVCGPVSVEQVYIVESSVKIVFDR